MYHALQMSKESILNRKLFVASNRAKTVWRWIEIVFMTLTLLFFEFMALASYPKFGLISEHTAISGDLVFVITQIGAIGGLWAIGAHIKRRTESRQQSLSMAWLGCTHCIYFIGTPSKFERIDVESYAQIYPGLFGVGVVFLCLALTYLSLLTWRPEKLKVFANTQ